MRKPTAVIRNFRMACTILAVAIGAQLMGQNLSDDFNRPDGIVGNGWGSWNGTILFNGQVETFGSGGVGGGIYRSFPVTFPATFAFDFHLQGPNPACAPGVTGGWLIAFNTPGGGYAGSQYMLTQYAGSQSIYRHIVTSIGAIDDGVPSQSPDFGSSVVHISGTVNADLSATVTVGGATYVFGSPGATLTTPTGSNLVLSNNSCGGGPYFFDNLSVTLGNSGSGGPAWTKLLPAGTPPSPRYNPASVFDPATNQMILFPGSGNNDVWSLSLNSNPQWTQLSPLGTPPAPRVGARATYDTLNSRMTIFGGGLGNTSPCSNDTWVLSNANGAGGPPTWTQLSPSGAVPSPRWVHSTVYDPGSNSLIVFGGNNCFSGFYNDVWALSHANGLGGAPAWTQLTPSGTLPGPTGYHTAVYDRSSNRMIVYGVFNSLAGGDLSNQIWVLTNANGQGGTPTWLPFTPTGPSITLRENFSATYDPATNRMTIFAGGTASTDIDLNDTWVLSNANGLGGTPSWLQLNPSGTLPPAREGLAAIYDPASNQMTIFGGRFAPSPTNSNDVWVLSHANGSPGNPVDTTPPVITPAVTGTLGANGWYVSNVTVTWSVTDPESGIASSTGCGPTTLTVNTPGATLTCSATNGAGLSNSASVPLKIDMTPPNPPAVTRNPVPIGAGWNNSTVQIGFAAMGDNGPSGVSACTGAVTIVTETAGTQVGGNCSDFAGNVSTTSLVSVKIDKTAPVVSSVVANPSVVAINTGTTLTATVTDSGVVVSGVASAAYSVDGVIFNPMSAAGGFGQPSANVTATVPAFTAPGIYNLCVNGSDVAGNAAASICVRGPVYDPNAGFVTGGGSIDSPAGADLVNPAAAGETKVEFVSKYHKGSNVPTGNLTFEFKAGDLKFKSTSMDWLVVTGESRAQFHGMGTVNETNFCQFQVDAWDKSFSASNLDAFGIKIYSCNSGGDANGNLYTVGATPLRNGSVVIHK